MKTFLTTLILIISFSVVKAQDFTLNADTLQKTTSGVAVITPCGENSVTFDGYLRNSNTTATSPFKWRIISIDFPSGWFLCQVCDNNICRVTGEETGMPAAWAVAPFADIEAAAIAAGDSGLYEPAIAVPASGENGCGVLRVKVWTDNTTDTATFIVCKTPTGVTQIALNDSRVNIYPNPAGNNIMVYAEKSLNATNLSIISITGQTVKSRTLDRKEATNIDVTTLSKGTYMIRLIDDKGQLITSRKFIKE